MASFDQHINQALKNFRVLEGINRAVPDSWDWQVTAAFYSGVHLVNAHLAKTANLHYRTHKDVKLSLFSAMSPAKIPEDIYLAYAKLEMLSRRARYLCSDQEKPNPGDESKAFLSFDKHLRKALLHLDKLLIYLASVYHLTFPKVQLDCIELTGVTLTYFAHAKTT